MSINQELFARYTVLRGLRPQSSASLAQKALIRQGLNGSYLRRVGDSGSTDLFLVSGSVLLEGASGEPGLRITAGDDASCNALSTGDPARWSVRCLGAVSCLSIDNALLEVMRDWSYAGDIQVGEVDAGALASATDWMMILLQKRTFQLLPPGNLQAMFQRMQPLEVSSDELVIQQGASGDYFYVVVEGRCQAWLESPDQPPLLLATFQAGECFGEESLLSGAPRSATVRSLTAARLLRLSNSDFSELLSNRLLRRLSYDEAQKLIESGKAYWLDVRLPNEQTTAAPTGSLHIAAHFLRYEANELPVDSAYICVCNNGLRSAVGAFVLSQAGRNAYVLDKGLSAITANGQSV